MDKRILIELVRGNPAYQQGINVIEQRLGNAPISAGDIEELIKFLEHAIDHPDKYSQLRAAAIVDKKLDGSELPEQFNPQVLISLLVALYGLRDRLQGKQQYAEGGLASAAHRLREAGRGGDTVLAHINPQEAELLKRLGASGTINPHTGLPEFGWSWKSIISTVLPVAIDYFAPGLGESVGSVIPGLSGTAAKVAGSALVGAGLGAGSAALTGGNVGQGALTGGALGGLSAGGGQMLGEAIGGKSLSPTVSSALGGALIGGGLGAVSGQDALQAALQGGIGGAISGAGSTIANKIGGSNALQAGIQSAARAGGNLLTVGADPQQALISGGLSGLATGLMYKPSTVAVNNTANDNMPWKSGDTQKAFNDALPSGFSPSTESAPSTAGNAAPSTSSGFNLGTLGTVGALGLGAAALLGSGSNAQKAVSVAPQLSQSQKEYFARPSIQFDWNAIAKDAQQSGQDVGTYVANHWNDVTSGKYATPIAAKARGGALSKIAYLAQGSGSGRDDTIDARLSDGEYVIDAETVALLGDGSNKEGARRLDQMRSEIRKQKGKKLVRGEFSINAKSPLSYIKKGVK